MSATWCMFALSVVVGLSEGVSDDPPGSPFEVIWNSQTDGRWGCNETYGIDTGLDRFGIIVNQDKYSTPWKGEHITIFYDPGLWPVILDDGTLVNGGLPQLGDLNAHLEAVEDIIVKQIPDPDFKGLGVLDFEKWRPLYEMNFASGILGRYQRHSQDLVAKQHPTWSAKNVKEVAEEEFDKAARAYFEATIHLAKQLRPKGKWGYYIYPLCFLFNDNPGAGCKENSKVYNERLSWLATASDVLYPSAYYYPSTKEIYKRSMIAGANEISDHWRHIIRQPYKPIYQYTKYSLEQPYPFYSQTDLIHSIAISADQGIDGIIFWGNNYHHRDAATCRLIQGYVQDTLGPYVKRVLDFTTRCAWDLCHNHGRCVKRTINTDIHSSAWDIKTDHIYDWLLVEKDYECVCYKGYGGISCDLQH